MLCSKGELAGKTAIIKAILLNTVKWIKELKFSWWNLNFIGLLAIVYNLSQYITQRENNDNQDFKIAHYFNVWSSHQ